MAKESQKIKKSIYKVAGSFHNGGTLGEIIRQNGETFFAVSDGKTSKVVTEFEGQKFIYIPWGREEDRKGHQIPDKFIEKMYLPSEPADYGSEDKLISEIEGFINAYLDIPKETARLMAYYYIFNWVWDCFNTIPYLRAIGDADTGKSRFLKISQRLARLPFVSLGSSEAAIFRIIDKYHPTLLLGEFNLDFKSERSVAIEDILLAGYSREEGSVTRVSETSRGRERQPIYFDVYGPKILTTRRTFKENALEGRCLTIKMEGLTRKDIPFHLDENCDRWSQDLRNKLLKFRMDRYGDMKIDENQRIEGIPSRLNEMLLPLFAVFKSEKAIKDLTKFGRSYGEELKMERSQTAAAEVFSALMLAQKTERDILGTAFSVSLQKVAEVYNSTHEGEKYKMTSRRVSDINRADMGFEKVHRTDGKHLVFNEDRAKLLAERYGLDYEELSEQGGLEETTR